MGVVSRYDFYLGKFQTKIFSGHRCIRLEINNVMKTGKFKKSRVLKNQWTNDQVKWMLENVMRETKHQELWQDQEQEGSLQKQRENPEGTEGWCVK